MTILEKLVELERLTADLASPSTAAKLDKDSKSKMRQMKKQLVDLKDQLVVMEKAIDGQIAQCREELAKVASAK